MKFFKKFTGYALALAFMAVPVVIYWQRQAVTDWWLLRGYNPPSAVVDLASDTAMTAEARHIFYVNHPKVIGKASAFRQNCASTEQTIVLGCYHGNQRGIFVYDVSDKRLSGIEQVTAAHEMLHAAYDRLDSAEKTRVNKLLTDFYKNQVKDERLIKTINSYKRTEPNDVVNEMHSIFGTEIVTLTPELETYYKQYFTNRQIVAQFASNYQAEFTGRAAQIDADDTKLKVLKTSIDKQETQLELQLADLQASRVKLDNLRSTGQIAAYNDAVPGFNAKVSSYNANIGRLQVDIVAYNVLVAARNALASEVKELDSALDTRLQKETAQ